MLIENLNTYQPTKRQIFVNRFMRFLIVGWMLHVITIICIVFSVFLYDTVIQSFSDTGFSLNTFKWAYFLSFFITVALIAEIDAYGRLQNYKRMKDLMHYYGFRKRLLHPFMCSRCQRNAMLVAAQDLGLKNEVKNYIFSLGYKWYHILPDTFVKYPLVIFTRGFWKRILLTKYYELQYFYW